VVVVVALALHLADRHDLDVLNGRSYPDCDRGLSICLGLYNITGIKRKRTINEDKTHWKEY